MFSPDVYVAQVLAEELDTEDVQALWRERIDEPVRRALRSTPPQLVLIRSPYRLKDVGWIPVECRQTSRL